MSVDEIAALSLTDVAEKIAKKELSAVEVTKASLDRMERHGEILNCIANVDKEERTYLANLLNQRNWEN